MNTLNDEQLRLFSTPEPSVESSFYDWKIDQEGIKKTTNGSGFSLPQDKANKLQINYNADTQRCQENQGSNATHTTNVKIQSTSTLNQNKQPLLSAESLCEAVSFRATSTVLSDALGYWGERRNC